ncbi:MAG TPA: Rpn family recombination-promoting nuclease/putative transposase [Blastocatellia bacterium]
MTQPTNPHDLAVREALSRRQTAAEFVANYLPANVTELMDLSTIEQVPDSFVDPELREHYSDLIYRLKLQRGGEAIVYVLIEHKSHPDGMVAFQLLRYIVRIWEKHSRESKGKLPPILPIVLYHGEKEWKVPENLAALIDFEGAEPLREFAPDLKYYLCDLRDYTPEDLRGGVRLQVILLALKYVFGGDTVERLAEIFGLLERLPAHELDKVESIRAVLTYWAKARGLKTEDVRRALEMEGQSAVETTMTAIDEWIQEGFDKGVIQGIEQGRQQGIERGRQEGLASAAVRLLGARLGILGAHLKDEIRELPYSELEELIVAAADFNTVVDLAAWIAERGTQHTQE